MENSLWLYLTFQSLLKWKQRNGRQVYDRLRKGVGVLISCSLQNIHCCLAVVSCVFLCWQKNSSTVRSLVSLSFISYIGELINFTICFNGTLCAVLINTTFLFLRFWLFIKFVNLFSPYLYKAFFNFVISSRWLCFFYSNSLQK